MTIELTSDDELREEKSSLLQKKVHFAFSHMYVHFESETVHLWDSCWENILLDEEILTESLAV